MASPAPTSITEVPVVDEPGTVNAPRSRKLSPVATYYLRRLGLYLITLWGSLSASFFFFRLMPGDPIGGIIAQLESKGQYSSIARSEELVLFYRREFGLDGSMLEQYIRYFERVVLHFDFGPSVLSYPTPATDLIVRALPWTLGLIGVSTILSWVIGVLLGTLVGWTRKSKISEWVTNVCLVLSHIPSFFVALFLIIWVSYKWGLLPANGAYDNRLSPGWDFEFILSVIRFGTLPVLASVLVGFAGWLIGTRALVVSILGEDFLTYANAKGLTPKRILLSYVLRNAWLPQIASLGIILGSVVNGNVLVERLFRYPGVGNLLVDSVGIKDVNTAQAVVTMFIVLVLTANLIIDLLLPLFDPRVKAAN
ncbi:MAG: ABC transporter permease [Thermomicrobiales bacterium]